MWDDVFFLYVIQSLELALEYVCQYVSSDIWFAFGTLYRTGYLLITYSIER